MATSVRGADIKGPVLRFRHHQQPLGNTTPKNDRFRKGQFSAVLKGSSSTADAQGDPFGDAYESLISPTMPPTRASRAASSSPRSMCPNSSRNSLCTAKPASTDLRPRLRLWLPAVAGQAKRFDDHIIEGGFWGRNQLTPTYNSPA